MTPNSYGPTHGTLVFSAMKNVLTFSQTYWALNLVLGQVVIFYIAIPLVTKVPIDPLYRRVGGGMRIPYS